MQENAYLRSLSGKTLGVYFNAYRSKVNILSLDIFAVSKKYFSQAYDGGGEENLTFNGTYCNVGGGLDTDTGIFTCPTGGTYLFMFHIATHDNKKALLSIKVNDKEIASVFDQNHKDNHKNSMAGTNVVHEVKRGDQVHTHRVQSWGGDHDICCKVTLYAYTGTWLADFPANHYTHFVGLLLQPSQEEVSRREQEIQRSNLGVFCRWI